MSEEYLSDKIESVAAFRQSGSPTLYDPETQAWYEWGYELADSEALGGAYTAIFDADIARGQFPQMVAERALVLLNILDSEDLESESYQAYTDMLK